MIIIVMCYPAGGSPQALSIKTGVLMLSQIDCRPRLTAVACLSLYPCEGCSEAVKRVCVCGVCYFELYLFNSALQATPEAGAVDAVRSCTNWKSPL